MKRVIFDWRYRGRCYNDLIEYANDIFNDDLISLLEKQNTESLCSDDFDWFPIGDIEKIITERFCSFYTNIKGFHACRPKDVSEYYNSGLLGQNEKALEKSFRELFSDQNQDLLDEVIKSEAQCRNDENSKIFFVSNLNILTNISDQYLKYGSEYISARTHSLSNLCGISNKVLLSRLCKYGAPTIFEVDIPIDCISKCQCSSIAKVVASEWCNSKLFPNEACHHNLGYIAHKDIHGSLIVGHISY